MSSCYEKRRTDCQKCPTSKLEDPYEIEFTVKQEIGMTSDLTVTVKTKDPFDCVLVSGKILKILLDRYARSSIKVMLQP